jgi:hypothetical protein
MDDLGDTDIMAYSTLNSGKDDDESAFAAGGAIMEALEQTHPAIIKKETPKKAIKPKPKKIEMNKAEIDNTEAIL